MKMSDQIIINFPELDLETYKTILKIREQITVELWKSDERKTFPLKWEGTRICCPITLWFDFPDNIRISEEKGDNEE